MRLCCQAVVERVASLTLCPGGSPWPVCASLIGVLSHHCSPPEFAVSFGLVTCSHHAPRCSLNVQVSGIRVLCGKLARGRDRCLPSGAAPDATGEDRRCVSGPPRASSMEGHTGHQKAGQIRGGEESRVRRGWCQLFWKFQIKTLRSRGMHFGC